MTVSLEGMEEGVGGRGCMKERGVLGGSKLGTTFFQASTKASSAFGATGRSVEKGRALALAEERRGRARRPVARRNMVGSVARSGLAVSEREVWVLWGALWKWGRKWLGWLGFVVVGSCCLAAVGFLCGVECGLLFSHAIS